MQHHRHPGLVGRLTADGTSLEPHIDAERTDARMVWFPVSEPGRQRIDALEGLLCVPSRVGAMRIVAVPHLLEGLTLGDEVAVDTWQGEPLARGELAHALAGTVRVIAAGERDWSWIARLLDATVEPYGTCWFDVIDERSLAASTPRDALSPLFAALEQAAARGELRWEYATASRH